MLFGYALITGACSGLGKAMAQQCAKRQMDLVLVEQPGLFARSLATSLQHSYGIDVVVYEFDLTNFDETQKQLSAITTRYPIAFLINNAGIGGTETLINTPIARIDQIIAVNVRSTAVVTKMLLPNLLQQRAAFILNVSSMAAFSPIAYKTVYPASKAFIDSFTLGLREEFKHTGLSVSALYPGAIMTNASVSRRILSLGYKGTAGLMATDEIADLAIRKTLQGASRIIPGKLNRMSRIVLSLLPSNYKSSILSRVIKQEIQFAPAY